MTLENNRIRCVFWTGSDQLANTKRNGSKTRQFTLHSKPALACVGYSFTRAVFRFDFQSGSLALDKKCPRHRWDLSLETKLIQLARELPYDLSVTLN